MGLLCFWSRRACSRYAALGLPIPSGSRLEAHMARCTRCRAYGEDLTHVASDLSLFLVTPRPSLNFAENMWNRPLPASRPVGRGIRLSLAAAMACSMAAGWVLWKIVPERALSRDHSHALYAAKQPDEIKMPDEGPAAPDFPLLMGPQPTIRLQETSASPMPRHALRHSPWAGMRIRRRHYKSFQFVQAKPGSDTPAVINVSYTAQELHTAGELLESRGDPGLANAAYQAAYQQRPTEQAAFDMGRSAEESGDMEQALDVYATLLDSADARTRLEKGTNR
jgi:hypothetical protein